MIHNRFRTCWSLYRKGHLWNSAYRLSRRLRQAGGLQVRAMRVHPAPKKGSITFRCGANASFSAGEAILGGKKKLRRLPHVFSKVLELPFRADADVSVAEFPKCFRFVAPASTGFEGGVRADAIQIYPGVMKIVIRQNDIVAGHEPIEDELELDRWRFRLPPSTRPALATAEFADGQLIVTVPNDSGEKELQNL